MKEEATRFPKAYYGQSAKVKCNCYLSGTRGLCSHRNQYNYCFTKFLITSTLSRPPLLNFMFCMVYHKVK
jgi:hypothetical protein